MHELRRAIVQFDKGVKSYETEFRVVRPDGEIRWLFGTAAATTDKTGRVVWGFEHDAPAEIGWASPRQQA